ncbi:ABC transporter substrate-binding protein [Variovorax sp. J22R133]|uniref:ABC transporter substrate-binding protein n=1 Tax=Variovorax brevis TaxID=3053503 RepID=UPI002578B05E|nr:ABC transporter substrate-binding protein [Variovorax sp. J22R133]MDM0117028.1 ABC transporter substrate-binding protein [Variovorax sp. J22R133]
MLIAGAASCIPGGVPGRLFAQTHRAINDKLESSRRSAHVGVLLFGAAPQGESSERFAPLRRRLRELGYIEGKTIQIDIRRGTDSRQLVEHAEDLVRSKVDVIVTAGTEVREVAQRATVSIPIVAIAGSDPVAEGWANSLARPGGNITGLTVTLPQMGQKQLELLQMAVPGLKRVAAMMTTPMYERKLQDAAGKLSVQLIILLVKEQTDFDSAFKTAGAERAQALLALPTPLIFEHRAQLARRAIDARLPSISVLPPLAEAGFLMSYGVNFDSLIWRAADYVDRILNGASPGEIPIEQPREFEFVINRATAGALNIKLPPSLLQRASRIVG